MTMEMHNFLDRKVRLVGCTNEYFDNLTEKKQDKHFENLQTVKLSNCDLFLDEENDDWNDENFYDDQSDIKTFSRESNSYESATKYSKRPLEAISLRQPKNLQTTEQKKLPYVKESKDEDWPDEMDFKVERWQRASENENNTSRDQSIQQVQSKSRNLPRSRRRRVQFGKFFNS